MDVFRNKLLRVWTCLLLVIWFVNNLTYYSINFTVTYLPGDRYLNFFLYGLMEVPAYILTWIVLQKIGRRIPLCVFHIVSGTALLATFIQTFEWGKDATWAVITLSVTGKFFITCSYATVYVHTPEIFPTSIRNTGLGMCMFMAKLASFIGPYSRVLARYHAWLSPVITGSMSILAGILALFLPETRWVPLPETLEELDEWGTKDQSKKNNAIYKAAPQHESLEMI